MTPAWWVSVCYFLPFSVLLHPSLGCALLKESRVIEFSDSSTVSHWCITFKFRLDWTWIVCAFSEEERHGDLANSCNLCPPLPGPLPTNSEMIKPTLSNHGDTLLSRYMPDSVCMLFNHFSRCMIYKSEFYRLRTQTFICYDFLY